MSFRNGRLRESLWSPASALVAIALTCSGAQSAHAQYQNREWANFEKGALPDNKITIGADPGDTVGVIDFTKVTGMPPEFRAGRAGEETGQFGMRLTAAPIKAENKTWTTGLAIGDVLDRDKLGAHGRALFQADFFFPQDGFVPNLAVLAMQPPVTRDGAAPRSVGAVTGGFYRFGITLNKRLYFSYVDPKVVKQAAIYKQDQELLASLPLPGWHRFAIVCEGADMLRFYIDGREASFSPLIEGSMRKIMVGVLLADANNSYDAYVDNLSIQATDEVAEIPESPYNDRWTIAAGPSPNAAKVAAAAAAAAAKPARTPMPALSPPVSASSVSVASVVPWLDPVTAWKKAQTEKIPMLLYFYAPGIERTNALEQIFATNTQAQSFLQRHICARVDVNQLHGGAVAQQYGVYKVPTILVIAPDAKSYTKAVMNPTDTWDILLPQLALP